MRQQLLEAIAQDWLTPATLAALQWMGVFTQFEVLVAARACSDSASCLFFEVQAAGTLVRVEEEGLIQGCTFQRIRVVVSAGKRWWIDPDPALHARDWRIWVYKAQSLAKLQWDPSKWVWLDSQGGHLQFFQFRKVWAAPPSIKRANCCNNA